MNVHIVTTCANRKKIPVILNNCARSLPVSDQASVQSAWLERISRPVAVTKAAEVYCGRGFSEIKSVAGRFGDGFTIISAGLGLISSRRLIPSYNLTISGSTQDNVRQKILGCFSVGEWWRAINDVSHHVNPVAELVSSSTGSIFVFALSLPYWDLIAQDLNSLPSVDMARVRICGLSRDNAPLWARSAILPYDVRFNGPDSPLPGTQADYPQRVCVHYVTKVLSECSPEKDSEHVLKLMQGMRPPVSVNRLRLSDAELIGVMRNRERAGQSSIGNMLRWLRDDQKIACEQARCARLYKVMKGYSDGIKETN